MRAVLWGTYDTGKPRMRIIREALKDAGVEVSDIHASVWESVDDKSQLKTLSRIYFFFYWLLSYPRLILKYIFAGNHDVVIVGYLGHLDVIFLWPFARLKGKPVVWDAFISLYDTVVFDRKILRPKHPVARLLWAWESLACRAASRIILDTEAHAEHFIDLFNLRHDRMAAALVGAETRIFHDATPSDVETREPSESDNDEITILFYGQFIPLHGTETIVKAAQSSRDRPYRWILIGRGQEEARIRTLLREGPEARLEWIPWIPYEELNRWIARADLCLGIFGDTGKAARVIPNKVFQIIAAAKPLITRESPAIRELLPEPMPGVYLVPPANAMELLNAIERFRADRPNILALRGQLHSAAREQFSLPRLGASWLSILQETIRQHGAARRSGP